MKDEIEHNIEILKQKRQMEEYCLNCINKPCQKGCPLENDIPKIIHENDIKKAYEILTNTNLLASICGRICPQSKQCKANCIRGTKGKAVEIGEVEREIGDYAIKNKLEISKNNYIKNKNLPILATRNLQELLNNKKVAIIGGGPTSLTCAGFLARNGIKVTIYEKENKLGGLLIHGIPEFRLSKRATINSIKQITDLGINVKLNSKLGENIKIQNLTNEYDAVFIGIGANISNKSNIIGEKLIGVYGANELLEKNNHPIYKGAKVGILGGGNVAMDAARTIKRQGAEKVIVIYRRSENEMPAEEKEIKFAKSEGIEFMFLTNITKILGEKKVTGVECIKTKLVQKESEKRLYPINIENSNFQMHLDYVIMATGSHPEKACITEFELNEKGYIKINENMETSIKNVYAGGDIIGGKQTVAWAARSGRDAAFNIIENFLN